MNNEHKTGGKSIKDRWNEARGRIIKRFATAMAIGLLALSASSEVKPVLSSEGNNHNYRVITMDSSYPPDLLNRQDVNLGNLNPDIPGPLDTSTFMLGRATVKLVLLQCDGSGDICQYNWTPELVNSVTNEVSTGLNWWVDVAGDKTNLSFDLDTQIVNIPYEAVNHPFSDLPLIISDALTDLGIATIPSNYMENSRIFDDNLRKAKGTDWGTTIFMVNSGPHDTLSDGIYCEYSYLNGPFMLLLTKNCGYNKPEELRQVVAHAIAHQFGAPDQGATLACETPWGYLYIPNRNSIKEPGCDKPQNLSILNNLNQAYPAGAIDLWAAGMLGFGSLADSNNDGVLDPAGRYELTRNTPITNTTTITLTGIIENIPWPPPPGRPTVTINRIANVTAVDPLTGQSIPVVLADVDAEGRIKRYTIVTASTDLMVNLAVDGPIGGQYSENIYDNTRKAYLPAVMK